MKWNGDDESIRQLFHNLKRQDERRAPEFDKLLNAPRSRVIDARRVFAVRAAAVAALILVSVSAFFVLSPARKPAEDVEISLQIAQWQAPTDFLLKCPNQELFSTVPTIRSWRPDIAGNSAY